MAFKSTPQPAKQPAPSKPPAQFSPLPHEFIVRKVGSGRRPLAVCQQCGLAMAPAIPLYCVVRSYTAVMGD